MGRNLGPGGMENRNLLNMYSDHLYEERNSSKLIAFLTHNSFLYNLGKIIRWGGGGG